MVYKGNLLTRCNSDLQNGEAAIAYSGAPPGIFGGGSEADPKGWNVYWNNSGGNYGHNVFVGVQDKTTNSHPHYVQALEGPEYFSYMLRTENAGPLCAHVVAGQESGAIDAGPYGTQYEDTDGGPGLGGVRNDAGAFGGQYNWWDPAKALPCFQYDTGVVNCGN